MSTIEQTLRIATSPRHLIINADDLGICSERDAGILELFALGVITSASLLVNGDSAALAATRALAAGLPLGLHLNLSEGRCDTPHSLTDARGMMLGKFGLRKVLSDNTFHDDDLVREIRRQFDTFIALTGELPSHVDGHHHIHVEPAVATVLAPIMVREYGVYRIRLPHQTGLDTIAGDSEFDAPFQVAVANSAASARPIFDAQGIYSTDAFLGLSFMGYRLQPEAFAVALHAIISARPPGADQPIWVELMVHPGMPATSDGRDSFCRSSARAHEMAILKSEAWRVATTGWEPSSFRELPRPGDSKLPSVLIYGKLTPATGNAETARRYEAAWSSSADIRFRPVHTDLVKTSALANEAKRLREFAACERLDLAFGIHLYRAGTPLAAAFASAGSSSLPYGLLASGTDANADVDDPTRASAITSALRSADFLLCLNQNQKSRLQLLGIPYDTSVLGIGIDVASSSHYSLRHALKLANDVILVLFPAGRRRLKGVLPTIESLAVPFATRFTNHVLVVLGPVIEADYAHQLKARITSLTLLYPNLHDRIQLHDGLPHEDYLAVLHEADLILNASDHEGLSHSLAEAMAVGVPVLARDIAGNRLLVRDGDNGRLFADFSVLPAAYATCFEARSATTRMAAQARSDICAAYPEHAEKQALRAALERALARRQTKLTLTSGDELRLDLDFNTHPAHTENVELFRHIALSQTAMQRLPVTLEQAVDVGCGCGIFGLQLLDALARQNRRLRTMIFTDPHQASLTALSRTLTRHTRQLPMLDNAEFSDGSLLTPLLQHGRKVMLVCANLPQTPAPQGFNLDRYGGCDGADLICALIAQIPPTLADGGEAFLLHLSLAHPARVAQAIIENGLQATVLSEQTRSATLADYEALQPGLADYLMNERTAGRAEFVPHGATITYTAQLLRICSCS